jgi:hypothetical protein
MNVIAIPFFHFNRKVVFVEEKNFYQIYDEDIVACTMNVHQIKFTRNVFFFNHLVTKYGFMNIILIFPLKIEYFTKKRRYYFNVLNDESFESSLFDIRYGSDSNLMDISEYLSLIIAISNYETEANVLLKSQKIRSRGGECIVKRSDSKFKES